MVFRIRIRHGATLVWKEPLDVMPWFEVMAGIQLAVLLEGTHLRALRG